MSTPPSTPRFRLSTLVGYLVMVTLAIGAFFAVRHFGAGITAPTIEPPAFAQAAGPAKVDSLPRFLFALVIILVASQAMGWLFKKLKQPQVIGEVVAGICLGPSLLGHFAPSVAATVLPATILPALSTVAQVGVVLFMFLVGLELDASTLRKQSQATIVISHASIVVPFVLGSTAALYFYPRLGSSDVPFEVFALFMGVSMSVTAFPVLARILTDRGIQRTSLGVLALSCAAIDDVTAWCLLAFVVGVARHDATHVLPTLGLTFGYVAFVVMVARPFIERAARKLEGEKQISRGPVAVVFVGLLCSALITEYVGIHALFGAFLLGAVIPHESRLARELMEKLSDVVTILFLPAFFAYTGLRTQIGLVNGGEAWVLCAALVVIACVGKVGGAFTSAVAVGIDVRSAARVGLLMNTRGLMELIVLNVGLDLGVLRPTLFAMLVLMAVMTTFLTAPGLALLGDERLEPEPADGVSPSTP